MHLPEQAQKLRRPARTVDADHIRTGLMQDTRDFQWVIAQQGTIIAREGDGGNQRQCTNLLGGPDGFLDLIQVAYGFDHDQIRTCLAQGFDLFGKGTARLLGFDASKGRDAHA